MKINYRYKLLTILLLLSLVLGQTSFFSFSDFFNQISVRVHAQELEEYFDEEYLEEEYLEDGYVETAEEKNEIEYEEDYQEIEDTLEEEKTLDTYSPEEETIDEEEAVPTIEVVETTEEIEQVEIESQTLLSELTSSFNEVQNSGMIDGLVNPVGDEELIAVWSRPTSTSDLVAHLNFGEWVVVENIAVEENHLWFLISAEINGAVVRGYIPSSNLVTTNEALLNWLSENSINSLGQIGRNNPRARQLQRNATNLNAFPASYRPLIQALRNLRPNWVFVPHNTGLDWNRTISAQMVANRNLVPSNSPASWIANPRHIEPGWVQASDGIVRHFMDPRNFINDQDIFQFELLGFNAGAHTVAGTDAILNGSFMHSSRPTGRRLANGRSYAQAFVDIGRARNTSPFHLASRVRHEQGAAGTSGLISGTFAGFNGIFNYFNFGATAGAGANHNQIITAGLTFARNNGWTSRDAALTGGANMLSANWIQRGQNTLYSQKFNVTGTYGDMWRQFMQNLLAPRNEGRQVRNGYQAIGAINSSHVFRIPVFNNMPGNRVALPTTNQPNRPATPAPPPTVPVFRLYRFAEDIHFFTLNTHERNNIASRGWGRDEGVAFRVLASGGQPVFRVLNPATHRHLFTMSNYERNTLIRRGWRDEGIAFRVNPNGTVPVFRLYNTRTDRHLYTVSGYERNTLIRNGWRDEGIAWRGN